jgi:hypothetical protein
VRGSHETLEWLGICLAFLSSTRVFLDSLLFLDSLEFRVLARVQNSMFSLSNSVTPVRGDRTNPEPFGTLCLVCLVGLLTLCTLLTY